MCPGCGILLEMPIIRSSRVIQIITACGTCRFGLPVIGLVWSCRFMCPDCGILLEMPIIRSSRVIQIITACSTCRFGLPVVGLVWSCRWG